MMLVWMLMGGALAQSGGALSFSVSDRSFPSGLRVSVVQDRTLPVVGARVVVAAGHDREPDGHPELAHLVEHLWFRSRPDGGREVGETLDGLGCTANAFTSIDRVSYVVQCPQVSAEPMVRLLGSVLRDPLAGVTAEVAEQELRVVQAELLERDQRGSLSMYEGMLAAMHPDGHPYHFDHPAPADVRLDLGAARRFVAETYQRGDATVVLAGHLPGDEAVADWLHSGLSGRAFHPRGPDAIVPAWPFAGGGEVHWPADPDDPKALLAASAPRRRVGERGTFAPTPGRRVTIPAPAVDPPTLLAWRLPPALEVGSGFSAWSLESVLEATVWEATGSRWLDRADCAVQMLVEETLAWCEVEPAEGVAIDQVVDRLGDLRRRVTLPDLARRDEATRDRLGRRHLYARLEAPADPDGWRLDELARFLHMGGEGDLLGTELLHIRTGQAWGGAAAFLEAQLDPAGLWVIEVDSTAQAAQAAARPPAAAERRAVVQDVDDAVASAVVPWSENRYATVRLPSTGLQVAALRTGTVPYVDVMLLVPRGSLASDRAVEALISDTAQFYGPLETVSDARVLFESGTGWTAFGIGTVPGDEADAMKALLAGLKTLDLDAVALDRARHRARKQRRALDAEGLRPWFDAYRAALPDLGLDASELDDGAFEAFQAVKGRDLRKRLRTRFRPDGALLVLVGQVDPVGAVNRAAKVFAGWKGLAGEDVEPALLPTPPPRPAVLGLVDPSRTAVEVETTCVARTTAPSHVEADVVEELVDRAMTRLLRLGDGIAYTPYGRASRVGPHLAVTLSATVPADRAADAARTQARILSLLEGGRIREGSVLDALRRARLQAPLARQTRSQVFHDLRRAWLDREGVEAWAAVTPLLEGVSPERLARVAAGCGAQRAVVVVGPSAAIDAVGEATGLAVERVELRR